MHFESSPALLQTPDIAKSLVEQLAEFQLTNAELLQILNTRPTSLANLHPVRFFSI